MNEQANYIITLNDRFTSPLAKMENKMNRFEGGIKSLQGSVGGLGSTLMGAFAGGAIVAGVDMLIDKVFNLGQEAVKTAREFTNMKDAIAFASGSNAAKNLQFLDDIINRLGLDMGSTYKGFKTFQGALMGTSLEGQKGLDIFTAVSEAASVMKLSAEQTEGTFLALGQMISKGNVQAEELRGQLGERLPGAFNIFARSLGVSTQKLNKMLQDGEVIAEKTLPLFAKELRKTFSPGVAKAQDSFNANMNRFNNYVLEAKVALGNQLIPAVNDLVKLIPRLDFSPVIDNFKQMGTEINFLVKGINELLSVFGVSITKFEAATIAIRYFAYLMRVAWTPIRVGIALWTEFVTIVANSVDIFRGLGIVLEGVFTKNTTAIAIGVAEMSKGFDHMTKKAAEMANTLIHEEKQGWKNLFGPINDDQKGGAFGSGNSGNFSGSMGGSPTKANEAGVEKIKSGTRNVTLNIQQLVGEIKFEKSLEWSEAKVIDTVKRVLLTAVDDVNIVAQ